MLGPAPATQRYVSGFENVDAINSRARPSRITGDADANAITGGVGGNDTINGGAGADTIDGGAGDDTIYLRRLGRFD